MRFLGRVNRSLAQLKRCRREVPVFVCGSHWALRPQLSLKPILALAARSDQPARDDLIASMREATAACYRELPGDFQVRLSEKGATMQCVVCRQPISSSTAWKGSGNRFYCSEFCAESESEIATGVAPRKDLIDRQYLERLQRLLSLRQQLAESFS